jgi:mono/diheme cytochrome c family protein
VTLFGRTFLVFPFLLAAAQDIARAQGEDNVTYPEVAPIFADRCLMCHFGSAAPLGLRLDSLRAILEGSSNGPVLVAGDPESSELIRRIRGTSQPRMPMTGPPFLSPNEIETIEKWVAGGLQAGEGAAPGQSKSAPPALPTPGEPVDYSDVAPIFAQRCAKCHTDNGLLGPPPEGYRLTSYESSLSAADRARIVPGRPGASELVRRIRGQSLPRMPFDGPPYLDADEIRVIDDWIAQGAKNSEGRPGPVPVGARVRLHGVLGTGWRLDGLLLMVTPQTRRDKSPAPGDYVEVRGRLDDHGNVIVDRIRPR